MWKVERIEIENIVSFRDAYLDITPDVATLIFGRNLDNASQPCNGSGKSSLIEAISFALTGEQLRKVKSVEEIINDNCDTASVFIRLYNDFFQRTFEIRRTISRKSPQVIECHKFDYDGNEVDADITVQPTVADYNRYILSEIGLTKDDLYSTFILCDNKYESFFDASDKSKKEIINRFSNGALVDEAIERLQTDIEPVEAELKDIEDLLNRQDGAVQATRDALSKAGDRELENQAERERQIAEYEKKNVEFREAIDRCKEKISKAEDRVRDLEGMLEDLETMDSLGGSLTDCYNELVEDFKTLNVQGLNNYLVESMELNGSLADLQEQLEYETQQLNQARYGVDMIKRELEGRTAAYEELKVKTDQRINDDRAKIQKDLEKIAKLKESLDKLERQLTAMEVEDDRLKGAIANARKMIEGAVTCPNCGFAFIVADDSSVEDYRKKVEQLEKDAEKNRTRYNRVADDYDLKQDSLEVLDKGVKKAEEESASHKEELTGQWQKVQASQADLTKAERELLAVEGRLNRVKTSIESVTGKIELLRDKMFTQARQLLEGKLSSGKEYILQTREAVSHNEGMIEVNRKCIEDIRTKPALNLRAELEKDLEHRLDLLRETSEKYHKKKREWTDLKDQETSFTLFKSYLARKKIDALSLIVNDFLEKIGSDIRLRLEGFTVTKTGKLRDKISVNVMRDGVDCGSFQKFSGGEKARLNLACILSLHTLTNSNCEDGRGLDFLIIDELLDKSDEVGMATYCEALNKLGQTALLITQGAVAEGYPYKLLITKSKGTSTISN